MRRGFTIWEFIIVVVIIAILTAILFPVFGRKREKGGSCQSNLKQIGLGFRQYVQDYDEKYPLVTSHKGSGWADIIQPYMKSWRLFRCPQTESGQDKTIDYFYNARLARFQVKNLESSSLTIMLGEGLPNSPANTALSFIPEDWKDTPSSPIKRHFEGANYAFADGHVKWMKPEKITMDSPRKSTRSTFLPR